MLLWILSIALAPVHFGNVDDYNNCGLQQFIVARGSLLEVCTGIYKASFGFLWIGSYYGISISSDSRFTNLPLYLAEKGYDFGDFPFRNSSSGIFGFDQYSPLDRYPLFSIRSSTINQMGIGTADLESFTLKGKNPARGYLTDDPQHLAIKNIAVNAIDCDVDFDSKNGNCICIKIPTVQKSQRI